MPEPGIAPGLTDLVRRWATTLADTKGVSLPPEELEGILLQLTRDAITRSETGRDAALMRFATLYSAAPMGIALAAPDGEIVEANAALGHLLGLSPQDLRGRNITDLGAAGRDAVALRIGLDELTRRDLERYHERLKFEHADDGEIWVNVTMVHVPGDTPGSAYPVLMVEDANELHLLQERLLHQNLYDQLTGLPNAALFKTHLETELGTSAREPITLIYLDIDGFRVINDGLGQGVGDQVLRGVAGKLNAVFTPEHDGFVARLSGDGFAILLRGELAATQVIALVQRALDDLAEPIYLAGHGVGVSASAGIVVRSAGEGGSAELLRGAEIALHRAKEAGKAQWMLFDPVLDEQDRSRYRLGAVIAGALENGEFSLIYQPMVTLAKPGRLAMVNAGLRWNHPERGELDSAEFYPLAEATGMTIPLGRWLLAESLAASARWHEEYGESAPDVCVRLPNRMAIDPDLVLLVKEQLNKQGLPAKALRLCIDRKTVLDPRGEVLDSLVTLSDLGAQLVLAVSGTSDLELIPAYRLPIQYVLLNGPVVDALAGGADDDGADDVANRNLAHLVTRARELNLRIGAEGVRDHEQADRLRRLGVTAARGSFVAASASGDEVDELIKRHTK